MQTRPAVDGVEKLLTLLLIHSAAGCFVPSLCFNHLCGISLAADIVNNAVKKILPLCVEGAKILDICLEGDKLIEQGTGAVWNKSVKGVKVSKGGSLEHSTPPFKRSQEIWSQSKVSPSPHPSV